MDYTQASEWLQHLANPERTGLTRSFGEQMSLAATWRLMELLGNPHERIKALHIAGTKGKGSVAAMVDSVCRTAGLRTGLFTSPHLVSWRERIRIDGECISEAHVTELVAQVRPAVEQVEAEGARPPSFFEALTAMAMLAFAREDLDICLLETGLGGRLDATNVVTPLVSVITTLGLDHTAILGDTLPEIAGEKAGIIKPRVPVVVAAQPPEAAAVIRRAADAADAPIQFADPFTLLEREPLSPDDVAEGELPSLGETVAGRFRGEAFEAKMSLAGAHQAVNAAVAAAACEALGQAGLALAPEDFTKGLGSVYWPARVELVQAHPWEVVDCAHNRESAHALMSALRRHLKWDRMILVLGASEDKPVEAMAQELAGADHVILTEASLARALPAEDLAERTRACWQSHETTSPPSAALERARSLAGGSDLICTTGSVFVIGELIEAGAIPFRLCTI